MTDTRSTTIHADLGYHEIANAIGKGDDPSAIMFGYLIPDLLAIWHYTDFLPHTDIVIVVRGAIMEELKARDPAAYRRWMGMGGDPRHHFHPR